MQVSGATIELTRVEYDLAKHSRHRTLCLLVCSATHDGTTLSFSTRDRAAVAAALIAPIVEGADTKKELKKLLNMEKQFANKVKTDPQSRLAKMMPMVHEIVEDAIGTWDKSAFTKTAKYLGQIYVEKHD